MLNDLEYVQNTLLIGMCNYDLDNGKEHENSTYLHTLPVILTLLTAGVFKNHRIIMLNR